MEKIVKERRFFYILLLISLAGFLVLPKICLAEDFDDINLYELGKHLELPREDAQKLIDSLRQVLTTEGIFLWSSGYTTDEKTAAGIILLNVVKVEMLNHLLVDAPVEIIKGIIKAAIEISKVVLVKDVSAVLDKFEKETVQRAINYGMDFLLGNEIRVAPGAIKFKYPSNFGGEKEVIFQYVMIYKPINTKRGEVEIKFYSPEPIEPPDPNKFSKQLQIPNLQRNLAPFIVEVKGIVERNEFNNYRWVDESGRLVYPSVNIDFPPEVPDLGIKPLSFWEKQILKPIETTIKEVEIIITKITGKSLGLIDIWNEIKSFISKIRSFSPAGLVETSTGGLENISNILNLQTEKLSPENLIEDELQSNETEIKQEQKPEQELTLEEMQEILDDIAERIDILNQQVAELVEVRLQQTEKETKKIEEIDEAEEIEEIEKMEELEESELAEETAQVDKIFLCEKIGQPTKNKVIFNEIAWMGTDNSVNDEWIELKNISGTPIDLTGWQILDKENQIKIIFASGKLFSVNGLLLLERTDDNSVPGVTADLIYAGILNNTDEALYFFDQNCQLQDEVLANPNWPAGDNSSKRTMERKYDLSWQTSLNPGGTPKTENSSGYIVQPTGGGGGGSSNSSSVSTPPQQIPAPSSTSSLPQILITEIQIASVSSNNDEFIELYNPNDQEVDISSWSIQKSHSTSNVVYKKNFETGNKIPVKGYFLIVYASSTDQNLLNLADFTHKTFNLAPDNTIYLVVNQEKIENASDTDIINMVGFGENVFSEGNSAPEPQDSESIGRRWSSTTQNYINTDNNQNDFEIQNPTPKTQNQSPRPTENQLPIVQFIYSPANPIINQEIIFDASSSTDPNGTITSYSWDFGDSTTSTEIKATTTHSYSTSSDFLVSLTVVDNNNATSSATTTITITTPENPTLEVVINEIAWMGTAISSNDEWFELYNNSDQDIDLANWKIKKNGEEFIIFSTSSANSIATTTILAHQYYLLESTNNNTISNINADFIFKGNLRFNDAGNELELRDKDGNLIDQVSCFKNAGGECQSWFVGDKNLKISMERISAATTGVTSTNWANNNLITRNGQDAAGNNINGTPRTKNSVSISPTTISSLPFDEFSEITLTYYGNPYIIQNTLTIPATNTLKIEPGVTLKFDSNAGLEVSGTLKVIGQENKKIIFTSSAEPNYWQGIYFTASSINSELIWVDIQYGRRNVGESPAILVENSSIFFASSTLENYSGNNSRGLKLVNSSSTIKNTNFLGSGTVGIQIERGSPTIKNCEIKNNTHGIYIPLFAEGDLPDIEGNNFEGNEKAIYALSPNIILKNNRGKDNTFNGILIVGNVNKENLIWYKNDLPYIIYPWIDINAGKKLTIEAGTVIYFNNGAYFNVNGTLLAQGTAVEPIILTALPTQAPWRRIYFTASSTNSILENVIVSQGGGYNSQGQIYVEGSSIEFKNSTSTNSYEAGIYLENSSSTISNSYFANNQFGIKIYGSGYPQLLEGISFASNTALYYSDIFIDNINQCRSCLPGYLATSTNNNCP